MYVYADHVFWSQRLGQVRISAFDYADDTVHKDCYTLEKINLDDPDISGEVEIQIHFHVNKNNLPYRYAVLEVFNEYVGAQSDWTPEAQKKHLDLELREKWKILKEKNLHAQCQRNIIEMEKPWSYFIKIFSQSPIIEAETIQNLQKKLLKSSKLHIEEFLKADGLEKLWDILAYYVVRVGSKRKSPQEDLVVTCSLIDCINQCAKATDFFIGYVTGTTIPSLEQI